MYLQNKLKALRGRFGFVTTVTDCFAAATTAATAAEGELLSVAFMIYIAIILEET